MVFSPRTAKIIQIATFTTFSLMATQVALAHHKGRYHHQIETYQDQTYKGEPVVMTSAFMPSWYVGANVGVSHTHDKAAPGSGDSVTQIGPGFNVNLGYKFAQWYKFIWAGELGFTQYHQSSENLPGVNIANTEHFASYLAAVAELPLVYNVSLFGKLGVAYSYAKKVFVGSGASASANAYSPYYGIGLGYYVTPAVQLNLQWASAHGNTSTGSTDLTSLGITWNFA